MRTWIQGSMLATALLAIGTWSVTTAGQTGYGDEAQEQEPEQVDIIETARAAGQFGTLLRAIEAAGLTDALQGEGPFTVFAPTDEAFAKLPEGKLDELLQPENKEQLAELLKFHVVPEEITASYAAALGQANTMLEGRVLTFEMVEPKEPSETEAGAEAKSADMRNLKVNGEAKVIQKDIEASNGLIQAIDTVLVP